LALLGLSNEHNPKDQKRLRTKDLRALRQGIRVAQEVGQGLGKRQILLREVQGLDYRYRQAFL
jgi:hypothetical protein